MSDVRQAATVVMLRESRGSDAPQVLMARRDRRAGFAAGAWVFPGGAVDHAESEGRDTEQAARYAAVRECGEEVGLAPARSALVPFAYWVTPEESPKRFATWFFAAPVDDTREVTVDGAEIIDYRWATPAELIADHRSGELRLMPPTYVTLRELARAGSVAAALDAWRRRGIVEYRPRVVVQDERMCFLYQDDAGYETRSLDAVGRVHRCWMDSSGCHYRSSGEVTRERG